MAMASWDPSEAFPRRLRVAIAGTGADRALAERLESILELDGLEVEAALADPSAAAGWGLDRPSDVVLLVPRREGSRAVAAVEAIRARLPDAAVVVVLSRRDDAVARGLIGAGADGLALADDLERSLAAVVRAACASQISLPRSLRHLIEAPPLSYRERQILGLVTAGLSNAEIADRLYLAESTIKNHLSSAFRRLHVRSRREAAAVVLGSDDGLRESVLATLDDLAGAPAVRRQRRVRVSVAAPRRRVAEAGRAVARP